MEDQELVELILANDNPKRLLAFIQEAFLSKKILPAMKTEGVSEGWVKGSLKTGADTSFKLFQVLERNQPVTEADRLAARKLCEIWGLDAFQLVGSIEKLSGEYKLFIRVVSHGDGESLIREEPARAVALYTDPYRPRFGDRNLSQKERAEIDEVAGFLRKWSTDELRKLLFTRFVMNHFLWKPVDLDAVYFRGKQRTPFILEYKRKDAMKGFYPFIGGRGLTVSEVGRLQSGFRQYLAGMGFGDRQKPSMNDVRDHFATYVSQNFPGVIGERVWERAFGLDLSHASNVPGNDDSWGYSYLIWEAPAPEKISSLLDTELSPRATPPLVFSDLAPGSFSGVAFTVYGDSGSFDARTRLQMCIRREGPGFRSAEYLRNVFSVRPSCAAG
ncbi:hypothetical protein SAMN04487881_0034 [Marinobacter sp. es.048]|uniref:hypothetical protein n=1 Tax=Marinobacter sp. es.048 TaxID=1761795 RepID=UPI000B5949CB|nr:hypothetical protein [Marinobacter sp. es.048]SNC59327.1 hypothetical protein SAMN04487881_0034 [Marinobacter sp. es.048]